MSKIGEAKILRVDLTAGETSEETLAPELVKKYLGGRGLASKLLADEIDPGIDALSPENRLIFANGLLTGTNASTGGRYMVVTKGPLTGTIASSNSGGYFGAELRFAGYDMIVFQGKSEKPVYLQLMDGKAELKDASHVWGKKVDETTDILVEESGDERSKVSCIGPAGENQVLFASIMNDKNRAAGRTGVGAVMGSKNLKALVVRGDKSNFDYDKELLMKVVKKQTQIIKDHGVTGEGLPTYGTKVLDNIINETGGYPTRNFQEATFEGTEEVSGEALVEKGYLQKKKACYACPIACGRDTKLPSGRSGEGPEYETGWSFGATCGVNDLNAITEANYMCNELGLDTISAGATIAAAMELYEKGHIDREKLDNGPELKFGSSESIVFYTKAMAYREGIGDDLALGSARLGEKYGMPEVSMAVKKQELPAYDPRAIQGMGLNYATSNRGGCHVRGYLVSPEVLGVPEKLDPQDLESKPEWAKTYQDLTALIDSIGLCLFTSFALGADDYCELVNAVTDYDLSTEEFMEIGDRIYTLERQFNLEAGFTKADDTLPKRLLEEGIPDGPMKGKVAHLDKMLPKYYELRGWDKEGVPTADTLNKLGLDAL